MILGYTKTEDLPATTLDDVFRRAATRRPGAFALADPPNRDSFTDGPSRHLTYAEADRVFPRSHPGCAHSACRPMPSSASSFQTPSRAC